MTKCDNCDAQLPGVREDCSACGFPQYGDKKEKLAFNLQVIEMQHWMKEANKSVAAILSMAIVFSVMAIVVFSFIMLFKKGTPFLPLFFVFLAICYAVLFIYSRRSPYMAVLIAFLFYGLHTVYEFHAGMILPDFSGSDQGDSPHFSFFAIFLKVMPFAYIMLRVLFLGVFGRGLYFIHKVNKYPKIKHYLQNRAS